MRKAWLTSSLGTSTAVLIAAGLLAAAPAFAADTTVTVTKDGDGGWMFNPDPNNATPFEFTTDEASTGSGSLYVEPIGDVAAHKFIAANALGMAVADFESMSYDFLIAGDGNEDDADQFYVNVYVNYPESNPTKFYDCRFDYVSASGSPDVFSTSTVASSSSPTTVAKSGTSPRATCPATIGGMPGDSIIRAVVLNLGDTSPNDTGLAAYFDNVVVSSTGASTAYDFEDRPDSKDECKDSGFAAFGIYKNQGECIAWLNDPKG